MLGRQLKTPCPFCGGVLIARISLYKGKKFHPYIEATCKRCRVEIKWTTPKSATIEEIVAIAESRVFCMTTCAQEIVRIMDKWQKQGVIHD